MQVFEDHHQRLIERLAQTMIRLTASSVRRRLDLRVHLGQRVGTFL